MTSVLASPTLARWLIIRSASMNFLPAARPPLMPKLTIEPAPRAAPFGELIVRVAFQRWMPHPVDGLVGGQGLQHRMGIGHVPIHPNAQGLDALQQLKRIVGDRQAPKSRKPRCGPA